MPETEIEEKQEVTAARLPGFDRASEPAPAPTEYDFMVLVEIAARANLDQDWVIARLGDNDFIVERIDGDIFLFEPSWKAIRAVEQVITEICVASRKANKGKLPEQSVQPEKWAEHLFEPKLKELRKLAADHDVNFMVCWGATGCPGGLTTEKVKKLSQAIHQRVQLNKDRKFAALYGVTYPYDQVVPPGNTTWARIHYETYGEFPDAIIIDGQEFRRLELIEKELEGNEKSESADAAEVCGADLPGLDIDRIGGRSTGDDSACAGGSEDRCDACDNAGDHAAGDTVGDGSDGSGEPGPGTELDFESLLQNAQSAYDFLTLDLGHDERNHPLLESGTVDKLAAGALSVNDLWELIYTASANGWDGLPGEDAQQEEAPVEEVQGEVVDEAPEQPKTDLIKREDGAIIDTFTGEVLSLCEMLGFNEEEAAKAAAGFDDRQAYRFIEKIRFLQTHTETVIGQAEAFVARNKAAMVQGMKFYGHHLRAWAEAKLPRCTKDTKTKKKGDFKEKSVPTLVGDVCFKAGGGIKMARKWEADRWAAEQLRDLNDDVEKLVLKRLESVPEPLKSIVRIDFNVKVDARAAVKAAAAGAAIPGIDHLPKHELESMLIGTNRRGWTITKPVERLEKGLKELRIACTDKEDDDEN